MPTWSPTPAVFALHLAGTRPDPRLEALLRRWLALGLLAVALVPALRGSSPWLGWWPLWLVAMPAVAWWALHRFPLRLPGRLAAVGSRRRRRGGQARRRPVQSASADRRAA
ncbi:hypothetical protein [Pseudoxanthomonas suwonensis]|uniref:Transmembrane protein n=1 Tax=Pseudoxanthomonas suwonensis TaxID=314722 RepID=A0A0E3UMY9_9GAMM|nr:hypothetical protein [Pseudoxanthomonas suwonensis]AKC86485.1 hypothetical protein WQ53_06605 [Pseudoxanthomonas suwonensis]